MNVSRHTFNAIELCIQAEIDESILAEAPLAANNCRIEHYQREFSRNMVYQLSTWVIGKQRTETRLIGIPKNWFEHLKMQYAPGWVKNRWPVEFEMIEVETQITNICPHATQKWPKRDHIDFMLADDLPKSLVSHNFSKRLSKDLTVQS